MPQSLRKQLEKAGKLEEVVRYAELHGYIAASIKYDRDIEAMKRMLLQVTGDPHFGEKPILNAGDTPKDILELLVETFEEHLTRHIEKVNRLQAQLKEALTQMEYYKTGTQLNISTKLKAYLDKAKQS